MTLKQAIGTPLGTDPAPIWTNLFLYSYEEKYISSLISFDKIKGTHFHSTKCFIDDLCAINDCEEFRRSICVIYPKEIYVKLKYQGDHVNFLNLDITVNLCFIYKLFYEKNSFPFSIVRMPYKQCNTPQNIFYSVIKAELLAQLCVSGTSS